MNDQQVLVHIESDEKGYLDKQCPSENCEFIFKVNEEDWVNIIQDEAVWCPFCRYESPADQWFTVEQIEHAKAEALEVVQGQIHNALKSLVQNFNRKQPGNAFISISMKTSSGHKRTYPIPAKAAELMQLEIQCENCETRFAVIGSAYFCPACGHNSVTRTFSDSLRKIRVKKNNIEIVRRALIDSSGEDEAELVCRSMLETCISDGVVAFQKYCEGMYEPYGDAPFNAFQRLDQGNALWKSAVQKGFDTYLSTKALKRLAIVYQKRHLLLHNDGIVDSRYTKQLGDSEYKEGQRIVILEDDIDFLVSALEKLGKGIETACVAHS